MLGWMCCSKLPLINECPVLLKMYCLYSKAGVLTRLIQYAAYAMRDQVEAQASTTDFLPSKTNLAFSHASPKDVPLPCRQHLVAHGLQTFLSLTQMMQKFHNNFRRNSRLLCETISKSHPSWDLFQANTKPSPPNLI